MSLRLRQAVPGRPSRLSTQSLSTVNVEDRAFTLYTSAGNVVVLDEDLDLAATLSFWDALPYRASTSTERHVLGVCGISKSQIILAWSDVHVVLWRWAKGKSPSNWIVHSTIHAGSVIKCLDFRDSQLILGTTNGLEFWRADMSSDVSVWDRIWERTYPAPQSICLAPSSDHIAWYTSGQRSVHILTIDRKGEIVGIPQELRHPREIAWIGWRKPRSTSGDTHLYTITTNPVLRIYSPVLDDPSWFQLLSTMDHNSFAPKNTNIPKSQYQNKGKRKSPNIDPAGTLWIMDADVLRSGLADELRLIKSKERSALPETMKILEAMDAEENDVVVWVGVDRSWTIRSVINMDRKPPTLLKSLHLARIYNNTTNLKWNIQAQLLHSPQRGALSVILPPIDDNPSIQNVDLVLSDLIASKSSGIRSTAITNNEEEAVLVQMESPIEHFYRTPNGRGLLAKGETGEIGLWSKRQLGNVSKGQRSPKALLGKGKWTSKDKVLDCAIFAKGRGIVLHTIDEHGKPLITLQHLDHESLIPTEPVILPDFDLPKDDKIEMLLAVSDIDDGLSGKARRTRRAIITAASEMGFTWVWRVHSQTDWSETEYDRRTSPPPQMTLLSKHALSIDGSENDKPHLILPVDPMGWHQSVLDWKTDTPLQDMILTVSERGVLEFWSPQLGQHLVAQNGDGDGDDENNHLGLEAVKYRAAAWSRSGLVRTEKENIVMARCSSRKKTVLICETEDGRHELTIWDSNVSEFSTGLEHTYTFKKGEKVQDLDWTTTSDLQSVLTVGFPHKVVLVCEQRMSYVDTSPGWAPFVTIDLARYTSTPINDSIWLAGGSLAVGCGNQIYVFSRFLDRDSPAPSPSASAKNLVMDRDEPEDIFQLIAHQNGPLVDYHPTILAQCLLWNKVDLVKTILKSLLQDLRDAEIEGIKRVRYNRLDPAAFFSSSKTKHPQSPRVSRKYDSLFDVAPIDQAIEPDQDELDAREANDLIERLDGPIGIGLSHHEKTLLATIAQATVEVERQRRALDLCGLRYLISIRMYVNQDRRYGLSGTVTPAGNSAPGSGTVTPGGVSRRLRLSFRNIVWATHSESQDVMLSAATECCSNGKMMWGDAKRFGVFLWLRSAEIVKAQLEVVARNRFMADDDRDPTACSLIFFALGKKKVVHGLWRQAPGHKEQNLMLKFLANDFDQPRWQTAALKNAYALLSKQRYEYAAAFFMLAGQPKDAINICLRQLNDWQLAVALARVVEGGTDGPLLAWILKDTVLPIAFEGGHRWLATWAFWILGKRDLAVRVLISPMTEVASSWSPDTTISVGIPENDDPSLLLLFQHLKSKSLQTAKGTSEIPEKLEFDFVLHNARVFFRMGCHPLGLDLLRSWSFQRPFFPPPKAKVSKKSTPLATPLDLQPGTPKSTTSTPFPPTPASNPGPLSSPYLRMRRPSFMLSAGGRRESMVMDMDVLAESEPASRATSPPTNSVSTFPGNGNLPWGEKVIDENDDDEDDDDKEEQKIEEKKEEKVEEPRKVGNLMKELKQDVQQGAMEFSMDSFDF